MMAACIGRELAVTMQRKLSYRGYIAIGTSHRLGFRCPPSFLMPRLMGGFGETRPPPVVRGQGST